MSHRVSRVSVFCGVLLIALALTGTAFAQSPTATTGAATGIGTTGATVNGTVNANGSSTTVAFEYGLNTGYGLTVMAVQSPVMGSTDSAVSADLGELVPNTTLHYRVVATNANGTTYGADMTFTTLPAAPSVLTSPATAVTANGATLNGVVNGNGLTATVTFEYGTDTNYGTTVTADQSPLPGIAAFPVSRALTGLVSDTTYHYRVVAVNAGGTSYGADMTFTAGVTGAPPTATTNAASAVGAANAVLNGTVNANDASTVVSFEYGLDTSYGSAAPAVQSPVTGGTNTAVNAVVIELAPNTTYHYRVVATNAFGTTNGSDMTLTTLPLPPAAATGPAAMVNATTSTLNGTVNANGASTTATFEYGLDTNYGTTITADQSPVNGSAPTAVSANATGLTSGMTYHFRVVAQSAGGTTEGADMSFVAGAPAPTATTTAASEVGTSSATLNGAVNANGQEATIAFEFGLDTSYGRIVDAIPDSVSGSTQTAVAVPVGDLLPNATYHFRVVASSGGGTTFGADMTFTTLAAPSVTTGVASSVGATGATLNGTVSANGTSTTVTFEYGTDTNYGTTVTADQSPVSGAVATAVSRSISSLTSGTTYHYRAVGTNANGTTYGEDLTFFTSAPGAPAATTDSATLVVQDAAVLNGSITANNADTTVTFEYGLTVAYGATVTAVPGFVTGTDPVPVSAAITSLVQPSTYHFRAAATNANGTTYGADMTFTTTTSPAIETGGVTDLTTTSATLNGMANANSDVVDASPYFEYGLTPAYGTLVGALPSPVTGIVNTAISADLSSLTPGTTYHYRAVISGVGLSYGTGMTFTTPVAEPAPTAVTDSATGVGATTATFNGTVNASDTTTTVVFEYGFDTGYGGVVTADQSPVTGSVDTAVSRTVDTLAPNTTFHYRVVAQNADNTVYGADQTLTTAGAPPTAATGAASAVSGTGATLNGTVNPNNDSTTVTFEYGVDTSYGSSVPADQSPVTGNAASAVSAAITGLSPGTTYHFRVAAQNASGTTYGSDATFVAGAAPPVVTTDPASSIEAIGATLNGTVNAGGTSTAVSFEYGETTAYGRTVIAAQSPVSGAGDTPVSAAVTGLQPDTLHHFRVIGQNGAGTVYGADQVFITGAPAPTVTTGAASQIGTSEATLNGIVNANGNLTTVTFEYGLDASYGSTQAADQSPVSGTTDTAVSATLSGLQPGETYHFRVVGENGVGTTVGADATFAAARLEAIPTLSDLALLVFSILLMGAGVVAIRRGA